MDPERAAIIKFNRCIELPRYLVPVEVLKEIQEFLDQTERYY